MGVLDSNCFDSWPLWTCYLGNIAGLCSAAIWFIVLVPQVFKNARRRSIEGLSFLWALANFTASLTNFFFIFSHTMPLYTKISAVYMPCLEITMLFQFLLWARVPFSRKMLVLAGCICLWGTVIELNLILSAKEAENIYWLAIVLWCVETYPQVVLNMQRRSVSGLSFFSTILQLCGKITDFVSAYTLKLPVQFVALAYFSSTSAYISGCQFFWYGWDQFLPVREYVHAFICTLNDVFGCRWLHGVLLVHKDNAKNRVNSSEHTGHEENLNGSSRNDRSSSCYEVSTYTPDQESLLPSRSEDEVVGEERTSITASGNIQNPGRRYRPVTRQSALKHFRQMPMNRRIPFFFTLTMLIVFSVCFFLKVKFYALAGPCFSISVVTLSYLYRCLKEKSKLPRKCVEC